LREADWRLGRIDAITARISDWRDPTKITHALRTLIAQRLIVIALGYQDGDGVTSQATTAYNIGSMYIPGD